MDSSVKVLNRNNVFYNYFLQKKIVAVKGSLADDEMLDRITSLSRFSWKNHAGYYFDGRLENILFDYGKDLCRYIDKENVENDVEKIADAKKSYTIMHVATQLQEVGGHTRVLYQFLKRYNDRDQVLVLTDQARKIPEWFSEGLGEKVTILRLNAVESLFERSYALRCLSRRCNTVILYHHPYDVVPIMAFSHDQCPPVLIENHAHSWFWLGPSIADMVCSHTAFHRDFTLKTRPVSRSVYLQGIQIDDLVIEFDYTDKVKAREKLKLTPDTVCLITIGTAEKFIPNAQYDFFKTAGRILEKFKNVELFVIGIAESQRLRSKYNLHTGRIHFVGVVSDPSDYYKAADICMDALPQPSLGATLYATLIGMACPLFRYGAGTIFNTRKFLEARLYDRYIGDTDSESELLDRLEMLINNPDISVAIAKEIRDIYIESYSHEAFIANITALIDTAGRITHEPGRIPDGVYHSDGDSAEIADICPLQDLSGMFNYFGDYLDIKDKIAILAQLSSRPIYLIDIVKFAGTSLKNKVQKLGVFLNGQLLMSRSAKNCD